MKSSSLMVTGRSILVLRTSLFHQSVGTIVRQSEQALCSPVMPWVEHFLSPHSDMTNQLQLCFIHFPHVPSGIHHSLFLSCCNQRSNLEQVVIDPSCMSDTPRSSSDPSRFSISVIDSGKQLAAILPHLPRQGMTVGVK